MTPLSITPRRNLFAIDRNSLPAASQNFKNAWNSKLYWEKSQKRYLVHTNQRKIKNLIARFHSWNHLFMSDTTKACSRSAKKRTAWRSCDAQKQSGRRDSQPKLTKFSSNYSSSSCLPASPPKIQDLLQQNTMQNNTKDDRVPTKCNSCVLGSIRRVPATTAHSRIPSWMKTNTIVIHSENDEKG
jgi:hypothetical protein